MRIDLKSNQYYDFYQIRKILISGETLTIEGNFGKGKKYKTIELNFEMLNPTSRKNLRSYMKNIMKRFDYEGCCPFCKSYKIWLKQKQMHRKEVNNPKPKFRNVEVEDKMYYCETCKRWFIKDEMMYSDVILYYN